MLKKCRKITKPLWLYFLLLGFFPQGEISQLAKIPMLLEHYENHYASYDFVTFSTFIFNHYATLPSSTERQEHAELPFFSNSTSILLYFPQLFWGITLAKIENLRETTLKVFTNQIYQLLLTNTHWNPPKIHSSFLY